MTSAGMAPAPPGGTTCVDVIELDPDQWPLLKLMRLRALGDAPSAFVTTREAEQFKPFSHWRGLATGATWVVASHGEQTVGIASLVQPDPTAPSNCRFIESVWVEPLHRWRGVLRQMLEHLEVRARMEGATELRLWVLDTNESAGRAYVKLGFSPDLGADQETTKTRSDGSVVLERLMTKPLL